MADSFGMNQIFQSFNLLSPPRAISLSAPQTLAQQRQSESRVAMTMQPRGRLRSRFLDARWRPSRWMMRKERSYLEILHQMLERWSPGEDNFPPVEPLQCRHPWREAVREKFIKPPLDDSSII